MLPLRWAARRMRAHDGVSVQRWKRVRRSRWDAGQISERNGEWVAAVVNEPDQHGLSNWKTLPEGGRRTESTPWQEKGGSINAATTPRTFEFQRSRVV